MKRLTLLGCALVAAASAANAQASDHDVAAWFGFMFTPIGAFPQIETTPGGRTDAASQLAVRLSTWKFPGDNDSQTNFGLSFLAPAASTLRYGITLGWLEPGGSGSDGTVMLGGDLAGALWKSTGTSGLNSVSLDYKVSAGFGRFTGTGGGNTWSIVGQLPFKLTHQMANKSDVSAFVSVGFGAAGISDDFDSDNGSRPMVSLGGAWTSVGGIGVHLGTQKVMLDTGGSDGAPWITGVAVSIPFGAKK